MAPHEPEQVLAFTSTSRHAAELGLASLVMGGVLFLAAPITLLLAVQVWRFADQSPRVVQLHAWLARFGVVIALLTATASIVFGTRGISSAARCRQPMGLSIAGLLLSVAAFGLWVITAIGLLNTTESLLSLYGP
jgi:hypothetical protein